MYVIEVDLNWAKYIVAIGAIAGMTTSLCGSMFALPRCVYAMASDGLIFKQLAIVNPNTQVSVPLYKTCLNNILM